MNSIDLLLLVIGLLCVWRGYQKGFIIGAVELGTMVASLLFAFFTYPYLAHLLRQFWPVFTILDCPSCRLSLPSLSPGSSFRTLQQLY